MSAPEPPATPSRRTVLTVAAGVVLLAVGVGLGVWALVPGGAGPTPTSSAAAPTTLPAVVPTAEAPVASAAPAATAPAPGAAPDAPRIVALDAVPVEARCADERAATAPLTLTWETEGAERAWIGVATTDAAAQPFAEVATSDAGYTGLSFACRDEEQLFTLTVENAAGRISASVSVVRVLE